MITIRAILDTIKYISKTYSDDWYFVTKEIFKIISEENFELIGDINYTNNIHYILGGKEIYLSDQHVYGPNFMKVYNDDISPFYIEILTEDERIIQEIIE